MAHELLPGGHRAGEFPPESMWLVDMARQLLPGGHRAGEFPRESMWLVDMAREPLPGGHPAGEFPPRVNLAGGHRLRRILKYF